MVVGHAQAGRAAVADRPGAADLPRDRQGDLAATHRGRLAQARPETATADRQAVDTTMADPLGFDVRNADRKASAWISSDPTKNVLTLTVANQTQSALALTPGAPVAEPPP